MNDFLEVRRFINMETFLNTICECYVGLNSCAKSRASLCYPVYRPVCLASTSEPDMFLGVALVCPAFLNLLDEYAELCVGVQCRQ